MGRSCPPSHVRIILRMRAVPGGGGGKGCINEAYIGRTLQLTLPMYRGRGLTLNPPTLSNIQQRFHVIYIRPLRSGNNKYYSHANELRRSMAAAVQAQVEKTRGGGWGGTGGVTR